MFGPKGNKEIGKQSAIAAKKADEAKKQAEAEIMKRYKPKEKKSEPKVEQLTLLKKTVQERLMEGKKEESEYDKNMKIANDYDKMMMKQPAISPDGTPNPVANHYQSKYQEYFDRAMQSRNKIKEAENIVNKLEMPISPVKTGEEAKKAQDGENKQVLPMTYDHQDLARALKADYKFVKGEEK